MEQLKEAKRRLNILGVDESIIKAFVQKGIIPVCQGTRFTEPTEKMINYCRRLKEQHRVMPYCLVYLPDHGYFSWIILTVSKDPLEWNKELEINETTVSAYAYMGSLTQEDYEPGYINLILHNGVLKYDPYPNLAQLFSSVPCPKGGSHVS